MGQTASTIAKSTVKPFSWLLGRSNGDVDVNKNCHHRGIANSNSASLFVYKRRGSMYYDEDGDLAHEFYQQVVRDDRITMERCWDNLVPQGDVELAIPRLHVDLPVFLYEMPEGFRDSGRRMNGCEVLVHLIPQSSAVKLTKSDGPQLDAGNRPH